MNVHEGCLSEIGNTQWPEEATGIGMSVRLRLGISLLEQYQASIHSIIIKTPKKEPFSLVKK